MTVIRFFDNQFFTVVGGITSLIFLCTIFYTIYLATIGVLPVLYRLGLGLSKRKIAVFAEDDQFHMLRNILKDSKLFREKNIIQVSRNSIDQAEDISLLLVHYFPFRNHFDKILGIKNKNDALIIYAPHEDGRLDINTLESINEKTNSVVVNFKGRLLNDILICMITSKYTSA